jgi:hypothetical protein
VTFICHWLMARLHFSRTINFSCRQPIKLLVCTVRYLF